MNPLFPKADANEIQADPERVQALIRACQQDLYHGIMEISYAPSARTILFFAEKQVVCTYTVDASGCQRRGGDEYACHLAKDPGTVRIISLPLAGVRLGKILVEGLTWDRTFNARATDLKVRLGEWQRKTNPTLSQVRWAGAEAVMAIPGNNLPVHTAVFVSREQSLGDEKAVARAISWPEVDCEVAACSDHLWTEAYREYLLHLAFSRGMELLLGRYSDMSARRLANSASEAMNALARENHWRISSMDCQVSDEEIFSSPEAAFRAYQALMNACRPHMEEVIGPKLTQVLLQETIRSIDQIDPRILQQYPFAAMLKS